MSETNYWRYAGKDGKESTVAVSVKFELTGDDAAKRDSEAMEYLRKIRAHYKGPFMIDPDLICALYEAAWWTGFERGSTKPVVPTTASIEIKSKKKATK